MFDSQMQAQGFLCCRCDLVPIRREIQIEIVGSDFWCRHLEEETDEENCGGKEY